MNVRPFAIRIAVLVAMCAFVAGCVKGGVRGDGVVQIDDPAGLAELPRVIEAVQTAVIETQDSFPVQPHEELARTIESQCTNARLAARAECDSLVARANAQCEDMTGTAVEARCGAALAVADRRCVGVEKRLDVATLCGKLEALGGVSIRKATLRLEAVGAKEANGGVTFFVINIGGGKTAKHAQKLELVFTPVPTVDLTGIRTESLGGDVEQLKAYLRERNAAASEPSLQIRSRDELVALRSQQPQAAPRSNLADAERLIAFIKGAAAAASIERVGGREAPLLTNRFTVAFAFEVTRTVSGGLAWELTPYKAGFSAGNTKTVGNELVLEFGQPE